jgi:two-component system, NarL family, sensor histidine kinase YdfH
MHMLVTRPRLLHPVQLRDSGTDGSHAVRRRDVGLVLGAVLGSAALYAWAIAHDGWVRYPSPLEAFSVLMVVWAGAHALRPLVTTRLRSPLFYFAGQLLLVGMISAFARDLVVTGGLLLLLTGEATLMRSAGLALLVAASGLSLLLLVAWWLGGTALASDALVALVIPVPLMIGGALVLRRQVRDREQTQARLRALEEEQAEVRTIMAERQRIARELHDTLAQGVAGLILQLEATDAQLEQQHTERATQIVRQAMQRARATLAEARQAINGLRAETAAPAGEDLLERMREDVAQFTTATGIPVALEVALDDEVIADLSTESSEHMQRVVAEGLTNVARHAQARQVWVSLRQDGGQLVIEVRDDGVGFEPEGVAEQRGHYGLIGLRERARLAGGRLELVARAGAGTRLQMRLPIGRGQENAGHE